jgi:hypothetical protein
VTQTAPGVAGRLAAPAATALAVAAGAALLGTVSPEQPGHYPVCPFYWATGLYCPGCGGLRAVHALVHGDVVTAAHRNLLLLLLLPFGIAAWATWTRRRWRDPWAVWHPSVRGAQLLVISLVVFSVLRNLPWFAFLAP